MMLQKAFVIYVLVRTVADGYRGDNLDTDS